MQRYKIFFNLSSLILNLFVSLQREEIFDTFFHPISAALSGQATELCKYKLLIWQPNIRKKQSQFFHSCFSRNSQLKLSILTFSPIKLNEELLILNEKANAALKPFTLHEVVLT